MISGKLIKLPGGSVVKNLPANAENTGSIPGLGRYPGGGRQQPTLVFLPGKYHGQKSQAGYSPWDGKELDTTEYTHTNTTHSFFDP